MAAINDLISQIENPELRARIEAELNRMNKQKKFGLVFEDHLPESVRLYDLPVKKNSIVVEKNGGKTVFKVLAISDGIAECVERDSDKTKSFKVEELVVIAEFGTPIYPYLKPIDSICNAPDSDLWHTLIEADNYHALQLLEYLYAGKVDCIYIDPPYNTGARDWKYNNDYVDGTDEYRHSKWLSFMQRRLALAKKLLNPKDSVLIVTIDEKEYLHLGCLLEQLFPEANIQMVSVTINHAGTGRAYDFARVNEYVFFVRIGDAKILPVFEYGNEHKSVLWDVLRRSEMANIRINKKTQFFPVFIEDSTGRIKCIGDPIPPDVDINTIIPPEGCTAVFPIRDDGIETSWSCKKEEMDYRVSKGYIKVGKKLPNKPQKYSLSYIKTGAIHDIETGKAIVEGYNSDGSVRAYYSDKRQKNPPTVLVDGKYDARTNGNNLLEAIIGKRFNYPKSLYAVEDCIKFVIANKPDALILDFFAGSGTTLHAVNLLNAEDGGHRRCIMVTNNEVSAEEAKNLSAKGCQPGDDEWEKLGIARYVTWPRTVCSIKGEDINGNPLKGNYIGSDITMANGFAANAAFFKLGFLDKNAVALGRQFRELLPVLWMKAGAIGPCPKLVTEALPDWLIFPENKMAVLIDDNQYHAFKQEMENVSGIETLYIITDFEREYTIMANELGIPNTYQLYRDYLDNFRINHSR